MKNELTVNAEIIIDNAIENFLKSVNLTAENSYFRDKRLEPSAFEILEPANPEFYEYKYFERTLESDIREILINPILFELFRLYEINILIPKTNKLYCRFTNDSIENIFPYEFIVIQDNKRIGYRYTCLLESEISKLTKTCRLVDNTKVSEIKYICWDKEKRNDTIKNSQYSCISFEELFKEYFPDINYNDVLQKLKNAIKSANNDIGFETIPRLSLRNLSNKKIEIETNLQSEKYEYLKYEVLSKTDNQSSENDTVVFSENDYKICNENYINNELYKALIGNESFAKCFITAEYQFSIFKEDTNFDYTSVVCGYLKCIEQLLYKLMKIRLLNSKNNTLWIKHKYLNKNLKNKLSNFTRPNPNPEANGKQIIFKQEFEKYFDISLCPLIWFIYDDKNGWNISTEARKCVHSFLIDFAKECRNDHFHKDNIYDYVMVEQIRNNTILLAYLLLGGYKLTDSTQENKKLLGIEDDSFERLYKKLQLLPRGTNRFVLYFENNKKILAYKDFRQDETIYDKNGSVNNSKIRFYKTDNFSCKMTDINKDAQNVMFELSIENMPRKICYIDSQNKEIEINW